MSLDGECATADTSEPSDCALANAVGAYQLAPSTPPWTHVARPICYSIKVSAPAGPPPVDGRDAH
jgi:hypothetical protein